MSYTDNPGAVLDKILESSGIGDYTIEQVVTMADPNEYKVELAQVAQSVDFDDERKDLGPGNRGKTNL